VRLARWAEVVLHPQVNLQGVLDKPAPSTFRQIWRLWNLRYAKDAFIKGARLRFPPGRHRQLHMFNPLDSQSHLADIVFAADSDFKLIK
jgi:hypothetical protein